MTYKQLFPANSNMSFKAGWYFTGHCLALDEHPHFREQIIELFEGAKDSISFLKDGIPGPPEESDLENFIQLCSDHLIIPANYFTIFNKLYAYLSRQLLLQPSI